MKTFARFLVDGHTLSYNTVYLINISNLASGEYLEPLRVQIDDVFTETHPDFEDFNKYWELI